MRKLLMLLALGALAAGAAIPAAADSGKHRGHSSCGKVRNGYETILDGSRKCFERWRYAGGASMTLQRDGTVRSGPGAPGLGVLWYAARPYGDFSLQARVPRRRAGSGRAGQLRRPGPLPGPEAAGPGLPDDVQRQPDHRRGRARLDRGQLRPRDPDQRHRGRGDPRKTGSIYGFKDLDGAASRPVAKGVWSELEIRVEGQNYRVWRDGVLINEYENVPGVFMDGRPNDPPSERARAGRLHRPPGPRRRERRRVVPQRPDQEPGLDHMDGSSVRPGR